MLLPLELLLVELPVSWLLLVPLPVSELLPPGLVAAPDELPELFWFVLVLLSVPVPCCWLPPVLSVPPMELPLVLEPELPLPFSEEPPLLLLHPVAAKRPASAITAMILFMITPFTDFLKLLPRRNRLNHDLHPKFAVRIAHVLLGWNPTTRLPGRRFRPVQSSRSFCPRVSGIDPIFKVLGGAYETNVNLSLAPDEMCVDGSQAAAPILVAEDNHDDELLLRRAFSKSGLNANLRFVRDGEQVLDYLGGAGVYGDRSKYPLPTLVLLDLRMPKVGGLEVLERLQFEHHGIQAPIIVFTGSAAPGDIERAYALGAETCLTKPQSSSELIALVKRLEKYLLAAATAAEMTGC